MHNKLAVYTKAGIWRMKPELLGTKLYSPYYRPGTAHRFMYTNLVLGAGS